MDGALGGAMDRAVEMQSQNEKYTMDGVFYVKIVA